MRHIELHVLETEADTLTAVGAGLLEDPNLVTACADCAAEIGALYRFEPYCVVLDDVDRWFLCLDCAEVVTDPSTEVFDISLISADDNTALFDLDLDDLDRF